MVYIKSHNNFTPRRVSTSIDVIFREFSLTAVSSEHTGMTERIAVLLVCNHYLDMFRRNYSQIELPAVGINGCRNGTKWESLFDLKYVM
jgi:hypothetical protein